MHINKHDLKKQNESFNLLFWLSSSCVYFPDFYICFSSFYNPSTILALNFQIPLLAHLFGFNCFLDSVSSIPLPGFIFLWFILCFVSPQPPLPHPFRNFDFCVLEMTFSVSHIWTSIGQVQISRSPSFPLEKVGEWCLPGSRGGVCLWWGPAWTTLMGAFFQVDGLRTEQQHRVLSKRLLAVRTPGLILQWCAAWS